MKRKNKTHIMSRYWLIIFATLIIVVLIVSKLTRTVLIEGEDWNQKANKLLEKEYKVQPQRGSIYANDGTVMASNIIRYNVRIDWKAENFAVKDLRNNLPELCDSLAAMFPGFRTAKRWQEYFDIDKNIKKGNRAFLIRGKLDKSQCDRIKKFPFFELAYRKKSRDRRVTGLVIEPEIDRVNPYGKMARRSIGLVKGERVKGSSGIEYHGTSGLEKALDSLLYGKPGISRKTALTNKIVNWSYIPAVNGYDVHTTIDVNIQDILNEELEKMCIESEAKWGTAVIMEVGTGEIRAISNLDYHPKSRTYYEGVNHAVMGYELGSVMKTVTMLVGLEMGTVRHNESIPTGSVFFFNKSRISDHGSATSLTPYEILERSSNIGVSKINLRGFGRHPWKYKEKLTELGFMDNLNIGLAGERAPHIRDLGEKPRDQVDITRMSFGYSMSVPPMNVLAVYNAIANDGKYVRPRLVKELSHDGITDTVFPVSYVRPRLCSSKNAEYLRGMLHQVVWGERGTGRRLKNKYVEIAGKTGTSFVIMPGVGYNSGVRRLSFCGFFPYSKPKYSCIVVLERGKLGAGASSGQVLKNVALKLYARGMLDNTSDFREGIEDVKSKRGVVYASPDKKLNSEMKAEMGLSGTATFMKPEQHPAGTVPSVVGYGLTDAISVIEKAGYNVKISGEGYVVGQTPVAGTPLQKGDCVTLRLKL